MATIQHISDSVRVTSIEYQEGGVEDFAEAAMDLAAKAGCWGLYDIAKCFNPDYIDTGLREDDALVAQARARLSDGKQSVEPDYDYWLDAFPLARESIEAALRHNEHKHGEGVKLSMWPIELDKAIRHAKAAYNSPRNDADCTYHITSAAARMLKAVEAFIADHGQYVPHEGIKDRLERIKITGVKND